jgi:starch phosphorylase
MANKKLALKTLNKANGVSKLHATIIARDMWQAIWTNLLRKKVPITHVKNGVHTNTWISNEILDLFDRYLRNCRRDEPVTIQFWNGVTQIPNAEI